MTTSKTGRARRIALPLAAFTVAATGLAAVSSGAIFTSQDTITGNTFSSGTVMIDATPNTVTWDAGNMAPGDSVYAKLNVKNGGTLEQRYAVKLDATNTDAKGLANYLRLTVVPAATCDATTSFTTPLYDAVMGTTGTKVIGDAAQGTQAGDRVLAAGAAEDLCFKVSFPKGTAAVDNPYQGSTTTATLTFDAEQTKNN